MLKDTSMTPPCGWIYDCWDGFKCKAGTYNMLVVAVKLHYRVNAEPEPDDLEVQIQSQICTKVDASMCKGGNGKLFPSFKAVTKGTEALFEIFKDGEEAVCSQEEAERRAIICSECSDNMTLYNCITCMAIGKTFRTLFKGRRTRYDAELKACGVCKCINMAQVHCSDKILKGLYSGEVYPDGCWKKEIVDNE